MDKKYIEAKDLDDFRDDIMDRFLTLCNYNDYNKLTLLLIGETVDEIYDKYISKPLADVNPVVRVEARPLEQWGEDDGDVLWWKFPIEEPPYVGSPLDCNWSGCHTHWTPIEVPDPPNCGADMRGKDDGET